MDIYVMLDCERLDDKQEKQLRKSSVAMITAIESFVVENPQADIRTLFHTAAESDLLDWQLGIELSVKKIAQLKLVLDFFNLLAKEYRQDFVLGIIEGETREDICYFGFEEGTADRFLIAQYLGL